MITRTPQYTATAWQREEALELTSLASRPLGRVGNLQFTVQQGGTPRASHISAFCSTLRMKLSTLVFLFVPSAEDRLARSLRASTIQSNSLAIGDLLGSLTARKDDTSAHYQIALKLAVIADRSHGNVYRLHGAWTCMSTYMSELTDNDIKALDEGVLHSPQGKKAVLDQISLMNRDLPCQDESEKYRNASAVFDQFMMALHTELSKRAVAYNFYSSPAIREAGANW